ncbi:hypothetical protein HYW20_07075 [Candidatus Woesearchaeota archaeon]|nr:hypothetical protein [Candidatus Woesearchaeota archaeon]
MTTKPLSSQQLQKYAALWNKLGSRPFEFEDAEKILKLNESHLLVTLHRLKQKGWLSTKPHPTASKKSLYRIIPPNNAVRGLSK